MIAESLNAADGQAAADSGRSPIQGSTRHSGTCMVDTGTWNRLDEAARQEFRQLFHQFQKSLGLNGIHDGYDLGMDWSVQLIDDVWAISDGTRTLEGVTSKHRDVIDALYTDGVQNLGR